MQCTCACSVLRVDRTLTSSFSRSSSFSVIAACSVAGWAPEQIGVIPRAVEQLFNALEACGPQEEWSLRVSFLEIHNEEVQGPPSP